MKRLAVFSLVCLTAASQAQLRVGCWNISNWNVTSITHARAIAAKTVLYSSYQGRQFAPDVLMVQEVLSANAQSNLLQVLNTAPGSPGDWAQVAYLPSPDTSSSFFYRTSRVTPLGVTLVSAGSSSTSEPPRNTYRFDFRPQGFTQSSMVISCYQVHLKAGTASSDEDRRLIETQRIRNDAASLNPNWNFLIAGDFNVRTSSEASFQELVSGSPSTLGQFVDPIKSPGNYYQNSSFRYIHTQDPWNGASTGGMDDRFDYILLSQSLVNSRGMDYLGNPNQTYSTATWNDPNHSYRCWGNDGGSYNVGLSTASNAMVGPTISQAIQDSLGNQSGHLPVFLDLLMPARIANVKTSLSFGKVRLGQSASVPLKVMAYADTSLWGPQGFAPLRYSLSSSDSRVQCPSGTFSEPITPGINVHMITLNTSTLGFNRGYVSINSDDLFTPVLQVPFSYSVIP